VTVGAILAGTQGLVKDGDRTLVLTGANTYAGGTTISEGTLQIGNGGTSGSIVGDVLNNGLLAYNRGGTTTFDGVISGTGGVVAMTSARMILTAANEYTGGTTIQSLGSLQVGAGGTSGSIVGAVFMNSSSTLIFNRSDTYTFDGSIIGSGGTIRQSGSGILILTHADQFSGSISITSGSIRLTENSSLQNGTVAVAVNGGLTFSSDVTAPTLGGLSGTGNIALTDDLGTGVVVKVGNGGVTTTYGGVLSGTGGLIKAGTSTLTLTGANTYTGGTTVSAGMLQIGNGGTTGAIIGSLMVNNSATLAINRSDAYTIGGSISGSGVLWKRGAGVLDLSQSNQFSGTTIAAAGSVRLANNAALQNSTVAVAINGGLTFSSGIIVPTLGGLSGSGTIVLADGSGAPVVIAVGNNNVSTTYGGVLSGSGGLIKVGSGTLTLTGDNTYSGGTTISGGVLKVGAGSISGTIAGSVVNNGLLILDRSGTVTFRDIVSGTGGVIYNSTGTLILTGSNSYSGGTTIQNAGTVQVGAGGTVGSLTGNVRANSFGTLAFNRSDTYKFDGLISGSGRVYQLGSGMLVLSQSNTYSGDTSINAGTVRIADNLALQNSTVFIRVNNGLTFSAGVTAPLLGGLSDSGNLSLADDAGAAVALSVGVNNISTTYAGSLGGPGSLTKIGTNVLTLINSHFYFGGTTVSSGVLRIGGGGAFGSIQGNVVVNDLAELAFNRSDDYAFFGSIQGGGFLTQSGSGSLLLSQAEQFSGTTQVMAGSIRLMQNATLQNSTVVFTVNDGLSFASGVIAPVIGGLSGFNGSFVLADGSGSPVVLSVGNNNASTYYGGVLSGSGGLIKVGTGTLTLDGTNTYAGGTTINGGVLKIGAGFSTGSVVGSVVNNSLLVLDRTGVFGGAVSGAGSMTYNNPGVLTLTGASSYSGGTTINGGTLIIGDGASSGSITGSIVNNGKLIFNRTGTVMFGGAISGTGSVSNDVGVHGTLILTGSNSYSGKTTVGQGSTLQLGNGGTSGNILGNVFVTFAGTLGFNRSDVYSYGGVISGDGRLIQLGSGTTVLTGSNSFGGETTITAGTLRAANNKALGISSVVIQNGARLDVSSGITISNPITFANGGTLSGNGTVASNVTISNGAILAPGNSPGTLHFSGILEWGPGGHYMWEINDVDAGAGVDPGWDFVDIAGQLLVTSTVGGQYAIDVTSLMLSNTSGPVHDFDPALDYDWIIAQATGGIMGFDAAAFQITTTGFTNSFNGAFSLLQSGNAIVLHYTAVPEPGTMMLTTIAAGGWYVRRRRKQRRARQ
jgi:autotransporter-associated beta strand protein